MFRTTGRIKVVKTWLIWIWCFGKLKIFFVPIHNFPPGTGSWWIGTRESPRYKPYFSEIDPTVGVPSTFGFANFNSQVPERYAYLSRTVKFKVPTNDQMEAPIQKLFFLKNCSSWRWPFTTLFWLGLYMTVTRPCWSGYCRPISCATCHSYPSSTLVKNPHCYSSMTTPWSNLVVKLARKNGGNRIFTKIPFLAPR